MRLAPRWTSLPLVACTALLVVGAAQGQAGWKEIHGSVVDAEGRPVADAVISTDWRGQGGNLQPRESFRTDAEGRFEARFLWQGRSRSLMAMGPKREYGAVVLVDESVLGKPLEFELVPLVTVRGRMHCEQRAIEPTNGAVSITAGSARIALASSRGASEFSVRLPPGEYKFSYSATDYRRAARKHVFTGDEPEVDLKDIELKPTVLSLLYGKQLPDWTVTDARGVEKTVALEDYRGKWVLLEFWGYW